MYTVEVIIKLGIICAICIVGLYGLWIAIHKFFTDDIRYFETYRALKGGTWYFYKFNRHLPDIRLFTHWTQHPFMDNESELLVKECYDKEPEAKRSSGSDK